MGAACNVVQNELMLCCSVALSGPKMGFLSVMGRSGLPKGNLWIAFSVKCTAPPLLGIDGILGLYGLVSLSPHGNVVGLGFLPN